MSKEKVITQTIEKGKILLPSFPSTRYINDDDFLNSDIWVGEEKIDGANLGITLIDNEIVLRNRDHILRKGYSKNTPAKNQFLHAWNWATENKKKIQKLNSHFKQPVSLYGEWCYAVHGIVYDRLPDYFILFDIYLSNENKFVNNSIVRFLALEYDFESPSFIYYGPLHKDGLLSCVNGKSSFSNTEQREGVYLRKIISEGVVERAKFVRPDYVQNEKWDKKNLIRQKILQ